MRSWVTRNRQSLSTSQRTRRTIPLQKRSADRARPGDTRQIEGEPSSTPTCDSANSGGVANFLQEQKTRQINPTNPTLNIPSHHFPLFWPSSVSVSAEKRLFSAHNAQALSIQPSILFSSVVKFPRGGGTRLPNEQKTSPGVPRVVGTAGSAGLFYLCARGIC